MNDFHKTFVLAFYDSFLKRELYFDKESMGQVLKKGVSVSFRGTKQYWYFQIPTCLYLHFKHDGHYEQGATELSRGAFKGS